MTHLLDDFQTCIRSSNPDLSAFAGFVSDVQRGLTGVDLARSHTIARLTAAWRGFDRGETGVPDLAVLLRQAIRAYQRRISIPRPIWRRIVALDERCGLWSSDGDEWGWVELQADDWTPAWLPGAASIDHIAQRRYDEPTVGNGTLLAMLGTPFYTSAAQKAAVEACIFAVPGSTTLVTLPTGAGKSLCALLPAWQETAGGQIAGGTTLVVVPTVSLALDQQEQAATRFPLAMDAASKPQAWTSGTETELRAGIHNGVLTGTLPILYTSPEALMSPGLSATCLEAAGRGHITRLVIDEAHIIETWGAGFRTEFQFLATFRRKLWEASKGQLRTMLLSATITASAENLLMQLFSGPGKFVRVSANRLRPEPSYWFARFPDEKLRVEGVLEALHYLPRPAILYVTLPETANEWLRRLRAIGFSRVLAFTGLTGAEERSRILQRWRAGAVDLMVANSAFGLGVDKGDVRAVVHACLPENIDRFYQEVGRGGRDGMTTASLLCTTPADRDIPYFMGSSQLISTGKAVSRWQGMRREASFVPGFGDLLLVDTNTPPQHDPGMQPSDLNREWNEHTLLLLQRADLLEISDTHDTYEELDESPPDTTERLQIRLLDFETLADSALLEVAISEIRERERARISAGIRRMDCLAVQYLDLTKRSRCIAEDLARIYPDCGLACGGCPSCRASGRSPYAAPLEFFVESDAVGGSIDLGLNELAPRLRERLLGGPLNLFWTDFDWITESHGLPDLLANLVAMGVVQLILPQELLERRDVVTDFVKQLVNQARNPHLIVPAEWVENRPDIALGRYPTVVVYPTGPVTADRFHVQFRERLQRELAHNALIRILQPTLELESEHGSIRNRIDGTPEDALRFQEWLAVDDLDSF